MIQYSMLLADLAAITALVSVFLVRHRRFELLVAYLGVNVGVLAVSATLASSTVGAGLGLGLFGVLSIIRLRSQELAHHEIAYYFGALAIGLICGLVTTPTWLHGALLVAVIGALWVGDHPRIATPVRSQELLLDQAHTDELALIGHLEGLLGADVLSVDVRRADLVNDTTLVMVRYRPSARTPRTGPVALASNGGTA